MTSSEFRSRLLARASEAGLALPPALVERLERYFRVLATWNQKINLTAIDLETLPPEAVDRLLIEPVAAARYAPCRPRVVDIGSGGGSPAIPFALACDAALLTMVESRGRKSVFLREAARATGLGNADVITARVEDLAARSDLQGAYDVATLRAVRLEPALLAAARTFVGTGGNVLVFGRKSSERPAGAVDQISLTASCDLFRIPGTFHVEHRPPSIQSET